MILENNIPHNFRLTKAQDTWFGDRIVESQSGRVQIPTHLYTKFRKIVGESSLEKEEIKDWLIENVYNKTF